MEQDPIRMKIQEMLKKHLGIKNLYFDPPRSIQMKFPCVVYDMENPVIQYADDRPYQFSYRWNITIIDRDGTKGEYYLRKMLELPYCSFDRKFVTDNLYHFIFTLHIKGGNET